MENNIDFLLNLLSKHNFSNLIWNVAYETDDKRLEQKIIKTHNYWKPLLSGYHKFLLPRKSELYIFLKNAFLKLDVNKKYAIIQNNLKFGAFLKDDEIGGFLNSTDDNWKHFALTFKENISQINLKEFEIKGSLNQIGRLLLLNKTIINRKTKIKRLFESWKFILHPLDLTYLSYEEWSLLLEKIAFNWDNFLSQIKKHLDLFKISTIKSLLNSYKINKSKKIIIYKKIINLENKIWKEGIKSKKFSTSELPMCSTEKINEDIKKRNLRNPYEWISIFKNKTFEKFKNDPFFDLKYKKPILFQRELSIPIEYYYSFYDSLYCCFQYYYLIMKKRYQEYQKFLLKKDHWLIKFNCDFYYYIKRNDYFKAGMLAIDFFRETVIKLFPWLNEEFQKEACKFWNVCEKIKKYMSKDYQYFIELTFYPERDGTTNYLNARNNLFHFKQTKFTPQHAFAIYCLAMENQRIINKKIPINYYKNWRFSNKDELL